MKRVLSILAGLVLLSAFAGTTYFLYSKGEKPQQTWETQTPIRTSIVKKTVATGSVVPRKEVEIKPQVSGVVEAIDVEPGQAVARGDRIARIRIIPDMITLSNAENRVNRARIGIENARRELERNRKLLAEGALSDSAYRRFVLDFENAEEELEAALDNLELIQKGSTERRGEASNTLVRATIDGMVLAVPLEEGDFVIESNNFNNGTTIATIADMEQLIFEGKVDESEVGKLHPGMQLLLTIGAIEDRSFSATLEHIAPQGTEENGAIQFGIRAALKLEPGTFVRANYSANADIVLDRRDDVLAIDEALLQFEDERPYVEVAAGERQFEKRWIETGLSDGIHIEVLSGLSPEDRIKNPNSAAR
jgi:HlyD family secretion protein